jgi:hypothetical protein
MLRDDEQDLMKEVVTLTSDISRKTLEKDFQRIHTAYGTLYRIYFDIYITLDGSEFNTELVCQGEVMGGYVPHESRSVSPIHPGKWLLMEIKTDVSQSSHKRHFAASKTRK